MVEDNISKSKLYRSLNYLQIKKKYHQEDGVSSRLSQLALKYSKKATTEKKNGENSDTVRKFLHEVVDEICGIPRGLLHQYQLVNIGNDDDPISILEIVSRCRKIFQVEYASNILNEKDKDYKESTTVDDTLNHIFEEVFSLRKDELKSAAEDQIHYLTANRIKAFDVSSRLIFSSSSLSSIRDPCVILKLITEEANQDKGEYMLELRKTELDKLLQEFENIDKVLNEIS